MSLKQAEKYWKGLNVVASFYVFHGRALIGKNFKKKRITAVQKNHSYW